MRKYDILFNGRPDFPVSIDQFEGTYIRRRCDVRLNLILRDVHNVEYDYVDTPPEMIVWDDIITWGGLNRVTWGNLVTHTWNELKTGVISGIHYQT